jgi:uncharacterized membrane protein
MSSSLSCRLIEALSIDIGYWRDQVDNKDSKSGAKEKCGNSNTFLVYGMILGAGIGAAFGAALGNVAIGVALGPSIGMVIGMMFDQRRRRCSQDVDGSESS